MCICVCNVIYIYIYIIKLYYSARWDFRHCVVALVAPYTMGSYGDVCPPTLHGGVLGGACRPLACRPLRNGVLGGARRPLPLH
jgi:hypothetical protein